MAAMSGQGGSCGGAPGALRVGIGTDDGGRRVVALAGELDVVAADEVAACLSEVVRDGADVVVDLGGLSFIDARGLAALVHARNLASQAGHVVSLRNPTGLVARALAVTGLDEVFPVTE